MNKIIFSERLMQLRKERGYASQKELAKAYNERFVVKKNEAEGGCGEYGGILGTLKNYENASKTVRPNLDIVCNLCDILECDIDFLLGKIEAPQRETSDVMQITGLTEDAVYFLEELKKSKNAQWRDGMQAINALLSEAHFERCAEFWARLALFLFSRNVDYQVQFGNVFQSLSAEEVLAILLRENETILREIRREAL